MSQSLTAAFGQRRCELSYSPSSFVRIESRGGESKRHTTASRQKVAEKPPSSSQRRGKKAAEAAQQKHRQQQQQETETLYHATSKCAATSILRSGRMNRGRTGIVGGAIYFAMSPEDATRKCNQPRGEVVVLACEVWLGAVALTIDAETIYTYSKMNAVWKSSCGGGANGAAARTTTRGRALRRQVAAFGAASVKVTCTNGVEYAIFDRSQISSIRVHCVREKS